MSDKKRAFLIKKIVKLCATKLVKAAGAYESASLVQRHAGVLGLAACVQGRKRQQHGFSFLFALNCLPSVVCPQLWSWV